MEMNKPNSPKRQKGMSLIEMSVSLAVMVGVAGMVMPYAAGFLDKAHNSTTVSTLKDLNQTITQYISTKMAAPDSLEALVDASGAIYGKLQSIKALGPAGTMLTVIVPGTDADATAAAASLKAAGITGLWENDNATTDATYKSTTGTVQAPDALAGLAQLTGTGAADDFFGQLPNKTADAVKNQLIYAFGGTAKDWDTTCTQYIVMGIGGQNSMVPSVMASAPVHFAGTKDQSTALTYNRYLAVFAVPKTYTTLADPANKSDVTGLPCSNQAGDKAKFVGSAMDMPFPAIVGLAGSQQYANSRLNRD